MKHKILLAIMMTALISIFLVNCTDENEVATVIPDNEVLALKVTAPPILDGTIDALWTNARKTTGKLVVPDPGGMTPLTSGNYFKSYVGLSFDYELKAMYDNENIYFLAIWSDPQKDLNRDPWYFDPATKRWNQESRFPTYDRYFTWQRKAFYEDKFAMLWNINESMEAFNVSGCYATCHTGLDLATHFNAPALHYTNNASELIDMWHWKAVRTGLYEDGTGNGVLKGQIDDQYQNNNEFGNNAGVAEGGRKSDPRTSGGSVDNKQTLTITGTSISVTVPKYVIPGKTNYYAILQSEIANNTAKLITSVDANGVLGYSGGSLDPNTDVEFQRAGAGTGSKVIPSVTISPIVGDRGDITMAANYANGKWTMEFQRKLNTGSQYDVQFNPAKSYVFGLAMFENAALAHAIQSKLILKFNP